MLRLHAAEQDVLVVVGEADLASAGTLHRQLVQALPGPGGRVLVELGALQFCDVSGLDALQSAARAAEDLGVLLEFRGMSAQLSWLHQTFPPAGSRAAPRPARVPDGAAAGAGARC